MEDEQELKQQFLREEILEKNYDPQSFIDFLITKKGETAADINNWSLEELKSIVVEFKNYQNNNNDISQKKEQQPKAENISKEEIKNKQYFISYYNEDTNNEWLFMNPEIENNDNNSNNNSFNTSLNIEHKVIEIDCLEPDQSPLSKHEKINIKVSSPKKEYESTGLKGFFMKTIYYTFLLENDD